MDIVAVCVMKMTPSDLQCGVSGPIASPKYLTPDYVAATRQLRVKKRFNVLRNKIINPGKVYLPLSSLIVFLIVFHRYPWLIPAECVAR